MDSTHLSHAARGSRSGAFTIMKLAGHSNVIVSQRYVHPTPESCELAFERLEALNARELVRAEGKESLQKSLQPIAESA